MNIKFSQNLHLLREADKLKQSELAFRLGVTQRKISYWENEQVEPNLADLWKIADYFNISIDELIGRKDF